MKKYLLLIGILVILSSCATLMDIFTGPGVTYKETSQGRSIFLIEQSTIDAANTKYWFAQVWQNGELISGGMGADQIANVPSSNGLWWNLYFIDTFKVSQNGPFTVIFKSRLIDDKYWKFEVLSTKKAIREVVWVEVQNAETYF